MFRRIIKDALFRTIQFCQIMNRSQYMFTCRCRTEMQVPQHRRKKTFNPTVLLNHFVMEIIFLWTSKFINLAYRFCQSVFGYALEDNLPEIWDICIIIQQQCTCPRQ